MNYARFQAIHAGVSSAAKKVYEAVPIAAPWSTSQIVSELHRCGSSMDFRIAAGCIRALIDAGLVVEQMKDQFYRTPVRQKTAAESTQAQALPIDPPVAIPFNPPRIAEKAPVTTTPKPGPIDKLSTLSARVIDLIESLKVLATDIDNAALEIEEQMQTKTDETAKLRQLRLLLKELG